MTDTLPMFDVPEAPRKAPRRAPHTPKPKWTKMAATKTRTKCDFCMEALARGETEFAAHTALYKRVHGSEVALLCYEHTAAQREVDGMKPVKPR